MKKKLLFTAILLLIYIFLRHIPLMGIENATVDLASQSTTDYFQSMVTGTTQTSIFILGLGPYMISSILFGVYTMMNKEEMAKYSDKDVKQMTYMLTFVFAVIQATNQLTKLSFEKSIFGFIQGPFVPLLVFIQMLIGVFIIIFVAKLNEKNGIGAMSAIILANIFSQNMGSIIASIQTLFSQPLLTTLSAIYPQLIYLVIAFLIVSILMKAEVHLPMERIMINNSFKQNSYISLSLTPVGVMPLMFSMAFFMLPTFVFQLLQGFFPNVSFFRSLVEIWQIDNSLGIGIFFASFVLLNIVLAYIMIDPYHMAENMEKSGDCIIGLQPGIETRDYLDQVLFHLSAFSSIVLGALLLVPIYIDMYSVGTDSNFRKVIMFMILYGISISLIDEIKTYYVKDKYNNSKQFKKLFGM